MRKLLWMVLLFSAYIWVVTSGNDGFLLEQGKAIYRAFVIWFEGAEVDFHLKAESKPSKKKARRWD